ncbi:class I SAM-dependent methyltransferase [Prosthecobacter sp.]|uniref:class I SAM-dependent methyltransferase n=1 Tax=Prosthecobacter sp. TaxID=1965333 RepID=UPI003784B83E
MPTRLYPHSALRRVDSDTDVLRAFEDHEFDRDYPADVYQQSACHWTPVDVGQLAAKWLVQKPGTRVLDIGCGPGKFCAIGAATTQGHFTGVEQRLRLVKAARNMLARHRIPRVEIIHGNITSVSFAAFDAFYLFNPFEENILPMLRIDHDVEMKSQLYDDYTLHVQTQLEHKPLGTRIVTYYGSCAEVPECYTCEQTAHEGMLKLWIKTHTVSEDDSENEPADDAAPNPCRFPHLI